MGRKCEIYKVKYENLGGELEEMQLRGEILKPQRAGVLAAGEDLSWLF